MTPHLRTYRKPNKAFTYVEVLAATLVVGVALSAIFEVNSLILRMSKSAHDVNAAMLYTQERVEQIRNTDWPDMVSGSYFLNQYFTVTPASAALLAGPGNITETVTVEAYPPPSDPTTTTSLIVQQIGAAGAQITQPPANLAGQLMARVHVKIQWMGEDNRSHTHETDTVISSSSGVTTASLPAMGAFAGGAFDNSTSSSSSSTTTTTGTTTTTTTDTTTTTTTDTTTSGNNGNGNGIGNSGNNGNGNGQGNVGGKTGKG